MSNYKAYINDNDLSQSFVIAPPERKVIALEPTLLDGPSIGSIFGGVKIEPMEISLELTTFAPTLEERLSAFSALANMIKGSVRLKLSDEVGTANGVTRILERRVVATGSPQIVHAHNAATAKVTFVCYEGYKYGGSNTETLDPSATMPLHFYGNAPSPINIHLEGVTGDSEGKFAFSIGTSPSSDLNKAVLDVGTSDSVSVTINSTYRRYYVNDSQTLFPIGNDWLTFDGSLRSQSFYVQKGSFTGGTVTHQDRWW